MRGTTDTNTTEKILFCFAECSGEMWEAFCIDFDLAVQGRSFDEVYRKMSEQIHLYVEGALALPKADRNRLLNRSAPMSVTVPLALRMLVTAVRRKGRSVRHDYTHPLGGLPAAA